MSQSESELRKAFLEIFGDRPELHIADTHLVNLIQSSREAHFQRFTSSEFAFTDYLPSKIGSPAFIRRHRIYQPKADGQLIQASITTDGQILSYTTLPIVQY